MDLLKYLEKLKVGYVTNAIKRLEIDKKEWYTVVIITNTPNLIDTSKCEAIDTLLIEKGIKFIK